MKPKPMTLTTLAKLADLASDDVDAAPDLRAYAIANAEALAPLFGTSTAGVCSAVSDVPDAKLAARVLATIKVATENAREAKRGAKDGEASRAADRVTSTARFTDRPGVVEIDAAELRAALACREDRLRLSFADGSHTDVNARALRGILSERRDARVYVDASAPRVDAYLAILAKTATVKTALDAIRTRREQVEAIAARGIAPVVVSWGERGGMLLRGLAPLTASKRVTYRAVNVPALSFGEAANDQAAE